MADRLGAETKLLEVTIDVHIMKKKEQLRQEKEDILKRITAISNYQRRGVIRMNNVQHLGCKKKSGRYEKVTAKHLDQWKKIIDQEALKLIPGDWDIFEFCSQSQDKEYLYCHVTPSVRPITLEYKLHVVSAAGDVTRVVRNFDEALAILIRNERSESTTRPMMLQQLDLASNPTHSNSADPLYHDLKPTAKAQLQIFQKNIFIDRDKCQSEDASIEREEITNAFETVLSNLISALANSSGGVIIVNDSNNIFKLVDGKVSKRDQDLITECLEEFIQSKIWGRMKVSPTRRENWDVQFPIVDGETMFTVHVSAFYGGVFESEPVAFTLDDEDTTPGAFKVVRMNFEDWFEAMIKRHLENEEAKQEAVTALRNIEGQGANQFCISNEMTSYFENNSLHAA